jgi:protein required for attachment to host cells
MQTTWVIAADSNRARIFEESPDHKLQEIEDMYNPEGRQADRDVISDEYGKFAQGKGGATRPAEDHPGARGVGHRMPANTADPQESMHEHHLEQFAKEVSRYLDKARTEHRFDKLRVIADPKFLGMMRRNESKEVQKMVEEEIPKELVGLKSHELEQFLRQRPH